MVLKSGLLYDIERKLLDRGWQARIRCVPDLREFLPGLPRTKLGLAELEILRDEVDSMDIYALRYPEIAGKQDDLLLKLPKRRNCPPRRSKLTYEKIKELRSQGQTLQSIATMANLTRERVRQICNAPCYTD